MPLASLPLTKSKCSTFDHTRHEPVRGAPVAIETHRLYQLEIDDPTGGWISCTRAQRTKYRQGPRWLHAWGFGRVLVAGRIGQEHLWRCTIMHSDNHFNMKIRGYLKTTIQSDHGLPEVLHADFLNDADILNNSIITDNFPGDTVMHWSRTLSFVPYT